MSIMAQRGPCIHCGRSSILGVDLIEVQQLRAALSETEAQLRDARGACALAIAALEERGQIPAATETRLRATAGADLTEKSLEDAIGSIQTMTKLREERMIKTAPPPQETEEAYMMRKMAEMRERQVRSKIADLEDDAKTLWDKFAVSNG